MRLFPSLRFIIILPVIVLAGFDLAKSQQIPRAQNEWQIGQHKTMEYQFFTPGIDESDAGLPLIVGLHGAGKRTADISKVFMNFHRIPATPEFQKQYPSYILAPKTTKSWYPEFLEDPKLTPEEVADLPTYWRERYEETIQRINNPPEGGFGELEILFELIDKIVADKNIDPRRIYIVGFSMGGSGVWQAIAARPNFFAAAIPAAGGVLFPWQWNKDLLSVPIWAFQGSSDSITVPARHRTSFEYAKEYGGNMKYTEFKGAGHGILQYVFTPSGEIQYDGEYQTLLSSDACDKEKNVWKWMFKQQRSNAVPIHEPEHSPSQFALGQNYPNPFNPTTKIEFSLPQASHVDLTVYDRLGRPVATLVDGERQLGNHSVTFDASYLSSGVYIYRIKAGSYKTSKRMLLVK